MSTDTPNPQDETKAEGRWARSQDPHGNLIWTKQTPDELLQMNFTLVAQNLNALETTIADLQRWKDAILDSGVIHWTLSEENKNDPRKAIQDLIRTAIEWENDSQISEAAAKRHEEIASLRAENHRLRFIERDEAQTELAALGLEYDALLREAEKRSEETGHALEQRDEARIERDEAVRRQTALTETLNKFGPVDGNGPTNVTIALLEMYLGKQSTAKAELTDLRQTVIQQNLENERAALGLADLHRRLEVAEGKAGLTDVLLIKARTLMVSYNETRFFPGCRWCSNPRYLEHAEDCIIVAIDTLTEVPK